MISENPRHLRWAAAVMATALVAACWLPGSEASGAPPQTKPARKKSENTAKPSAARSAKTSSASRSKRSTRSTKGKRRLPRSSRARLAQLHLDSQRVVEIQQALIREGALSGPPTGQWDDSTRDAMRRYQAQNGFNETGLPDAKSLMKLGLGPHPLPEAIQPTSAAQSTPGTTAKPNPN